MRWRQHRLCAPARNERENGIRLRGGPNVRCSARRRSRAPRSAPRGCRGPGSDECGISRRPAVGMPRSSGSPGCSTSPYPLAPVGRPARPFSFPFLPSALRPPPDLLADNRPKRLYRRSGAGHAAWSRRIRSETWAVDDPAGFGLGSDAHPGTKADLHWCGLPVSERGLGVYGSVTGDTRGRNARDPV